MSFLKGEQRIWDVYHGTTKIDKIYKGEDLVYSSGEWTTANENPLQLINCYGRNIKNLLVSGNSVQEGLQTPQSPIDIRNTGNLVTDGEHIGKYEISSVISSNNLFNPEWIVGGYAYWPYVDYGSNEDYTLSIRLKEGKSVPKELYFGFTENGDYVVGTTIFWLINAGNIVYNSVKNFLRGVRLNYISIFPTSFANRITDYFDIQLEKKSTYTSYAPYHEPITKTYYLDEPLRKGDSIDFVSGTLIKNRAVKIFDGTETFNIINQGTPQQFFYANIMLDRNLNGECHCTHLEDKAIGNYTTDIGISLSNAVVRIRMDYEQYVSVEALKEWLALQYTNGSPVIVEYELASPVEISLAGQSVPTFDGTTYINVVAPTQPEALSAQYYKKV